MKNPNYKIPLELYEIVGGLALSLSQFGSRNCAILNIADDPIWKLFQYCSYYDNGKKVHTTIPHKISQCKELIDISEVSKENEFLFINTPLGMKRGIKSEYPFEWNLILDAFDRMGENSYVVTTVLNNFWNSVKAKGFKTMMREKNIYLQAAFRTPEKILYPSTSIRPSILYLSKKEVENIFIADLIDHHTMVESIANYEIGFNVWKNENEKNKTSDKFNLESGCYINVEGFKGFDNFNITKQIRKLRGQYNNYNEVKTAEICKEINTVSRTKKDIRPKFKDIKNSIYIRKAGSIAVISNIHQTDYDHKNYYQLVLDESIVLSKYAEIFYKSILGQKILISLQVGEVVKNIPLSSLKDLAIALPPIINQKELIYTHNELDKLKEKIDEFSNEISVNPKSAIDVIEYISSMKKALGTMTDADKIKELIRIGETKKIEFKETLNYCIHTKNFKNPKIQLSTMKNIVGMLNSEGGTILIGVSDNLELKGLDNDLKKFKGRSKDDLLNHMSDLIESRIGNHFEPLISYKVVNIDNINILRIDCKKSDKACYLDNKVFYIRTSPTARVLEGPEMVDYINTRFKAV